MEITIRPFQQSDRDLLIKLMGLFNQYIQSIDDKQRTEYKEGSSEYFVDKMIVLCDEKAGVIFVACDGEKVIGFVSGYVDEQDIDEKMETIPAIPGVVGELFVCEEYRGQKVGKRLLETIELYLKNKGCSIIRFAVFGPNTIARQFYSRTGYDERFVYLLKVINWSL